MSEITTDCDTLFQVRLAGFGGQGVVLASRILGEALCREGYNVLQTQSYGIEARGGASCGEVLYSHSEIDSLRVSSPTLLLALCPAAFAAYADGVQREGWIFYDTYMIKDDYMNVSRKMFGCPFTGLALQNLGSDMYANIVALGFISGMTGIVRAENLEEALFAVVSGRRENNLRALRIGFDEARACADTDSYQQ